MKIPRRLNPTALCEAQEKIHADKPKGSAARAAARGLRRFWPALLFLPHGNIFIRQVFTLAALDFWQLGFVNLEHVRRGVRALEKATCTSREPLPFPEGLGYLNYTAVAWKFLEQASGGLSALLLIFAEQAYLFSQMALPTGEVPAVDTARSIKVNPSTDSFFTCEAFTVWREGGRFCLIHHDARIRTWRWRFDLHVENTFGMVVRTAEDWPFWYPANGWKGKRISIRWRFWAPRMEVVDRGRQGVKLIVGGKMLMVYPDGSTLDFRIPPKKTKIPQF